MRVTFLRLRHYLVSYNPRSFRTHQIARFRAAVVMGVPGFQTWFRREYPNGYRPVPPNKPVDHLYWDLPGTLHSVLRRSPTRTSFYQNLRYRVLQVLRTIQPRKRVVFAMDGPAPLAKLQEQRCGILVTELVVGGWGGTPKIESVLVSNQLVE